MLRSARHRKSALLFEPSSFVDNNKASESSNAVESGKKKEIAAMMKGSLSYSKRMNAASSVLHYVILWRKRAASFWLFVSLSSMLTLLCFGSTDVWPPLRRYWLSFGVSSAWICCALAHCGAQILLFFRAKIAVVGVERIRVYRILLVSMLHIVCGSVSVGALASMLLTRREMHSQSNENHDHDRVIVIDERIWQAICFGGYLAALSAIDYVWRQRYVVVFEQVVQLRYWRVRARLGAATRDALRAVAVALPTFHLLYFYFGSAMGRALMRVVTWLLYAPGVALDGRPVSLTDVGAHVHFAVAAFATAFAWLAGSHLLEVMWTTPYRFPSAADALLPDGAGRTPTSLLGVSRRDSVHEHQAQRRLAPDTADLSVDALLKPRADVPHLLNSLVDAHSPLVRHLAALDLHALAHHDRARRIDMLFRAARTDVWLLLQSRVRAHIGALTRALDAASDAQRREADARRRKSKRSACGQLYRYVVYRFKRLLAYVQPIAMDSRRRRRRRQAPSSESSSSSESPPSRFEAAAAPTMSANEALVFGDESGGSRRTAKSTKSSGDAVVELPSFPLFFLERYVVYWRAKQAEHAVVGDWQMLVWCIESLGALLRHSCREDQFGIVQSCNSVALALNALAQCHGALQRYAHATRPAVLADVRGGAAMQHQYLRTRLYALIDATAQTLRLVATDFRQHLPHMDLSPAISKLI
jgi:Nucleoporin protein Ndc1-Nup